jgi:hypothetical protein
MAEYVALCQLTVDGRVVEDFKSFTKKEIEYYRQVALMNKTGFGRVTPRYGCSLEYVWPSTGAPFDFSSVRNGTLVVVYEGGRRETYGGVYILKEGDAATDGEKETTQTIELGASKLIKE